MFIVYYFKSALKQIIVNLVMLYYHNAFPRLKINLIFAALLIEMETTSTVEENENKLV